MIEKPRFGGARFDFQGASVLVIGGSSGIGNAIAQAFHASGAKVDVWGTRGTAVDYEDTRHSQLSGLRYSQVDVTDDAAVLSAAARFETLDVLVLAQGIVLYGRREFEIDNFRKVLAVNLESMMSCAVALQPLLKRAHGALILVGSTASFRATRGNPGYGASKAGLAGLIKSLGDAWAADGIRVNGVAPGLVATKLTEVTTGRPDRLAKMVERIPMGRLGTPDEIAGSALFLASRLASYVVGEIIVVDGGLTLA